MNNKSIFYGTLVIIAGIILYFLINEKKKNKLKESEIQKLKNENKRLIMSLLSESYKIPSDLKKQILKLIDDLDSIEEDLRVELMAVLSLIEIGLEVKAIKDLAKIVEDLLREKYKNEDEFKERKVITLSPLIEFAKKLIFLIKRNTIQLAYY